MKFSINVSQSRSDELIKGVSKVAGLASNVGSIFSSGQDLFGKSPFEQQQAFNAQSIQQANINREFQANQAQLNRDFQERMSNTAHRREIKDLKKLVLILYLQQNMEVQVHLQAHQHQVVHYHNYRMLHQQQIVQLNVDKYAYMKLN